MEGHAAPVRPPAGRSAAPAARGRVGPRLAGALFLALGLNAVVQVPGELPGISDDPTILWLLQSVIGALGLTAGYGALRLRAWSWLPALGGTVATSAMILALGPILDLDADAREGLPLGAGLVLVVCGALAWYLHRTLARPAPGH